MMTIMGRMHPNWVMLGLSLAGAGALLCAAMVLLMAWSLIHPPRMTDGKAAWVLRRLWPIDLGLAFEDISFSVRDENGRALDIAGWWIPHPAAGGRCAVLVHGYADAKVGAIAWAPLWHELGFNLLAPDLRAHGDSEGMICSGGFYERHDLAQVIDDLRARYPDQTRQIVLFGASLGAAVAAAAAMETSVDAVVMDSPFADFRHGASVQMERIGAPGRWLQRWALMLAEWLSHSDYDAVRPPDLLRQIPCPVWIIESEDDPFLTPDDRARFDAALRDRREELGHASIWKAPSAGHLLALRADLQGYRDRLASFLSRALASPAKLNVNKG